jgi:DNA polymerase III delta prime subunit
LIHKLGAVRHNSGMAVHHALLELASNRQDAIRRFKERSEVDIEIIAYDVESLTIEDVRYLITLAYQTPGSYTSRTIVIAARIINREAQHALLKVLEEPPKTTSFYIILPSIASVLPTVLSRVIIVAPDTVGENQYPLFGTFVEGTIVARLEMIADIVKRKADQDYDALYDGLVAYVSKVSDPQVLTAIESALRFLRQKGAAKKMIWEHLALTLPVKAK